jgi:uncharacterized membrane protein YhaH (DUF805 family)
MVKLTDNSFLFSFEGRINRAKYIYALFASPAFCLVVLSILALALAAIFGVGVRSVEIKIFGFFGIPPSFPFGAIFSDAGPRSAAVLKLLLSAAGTPVLIFSLWFLAATTVKRLHDRDKGWWWIVPLFILPQFLGKLAEGLDASYAADLLALTSVVLNLWGIVELVFLRGTGGANRFGADPLAPADPIGTRPGWEQGSELEFVPHKAGPSAGAHVMRGHD